MKLDKGLTAVILLASLTICDAHAAPAGTYLFGTLYSGKGIGTTGSDTCEVSTDSNSQTISASFNVAGGATLLNGLVVAYYKESTGTDPTYFAAQYAGIASLTPGGNTITFDTASFANTMASRVRFKRYNVASDGAGNVTLTFLVTVGDCEAPFKAFFHATADSNHAATQ